MKNLILFYFVLLICCITFGFSERSHIPRKDEKPGRLPRSVYPVKQQVNLTLHTDTDTISGNTTFYLIVKENLADSITINMGLGIEPADFFALYREWKGVNQKIFTLGRTWNHTLQLYKVSFLPLRVNTKVRMIIEFQGGKIQNSSFKMGVYHGYQDEQDVLTQFEEAYARAAFPCFDEPFFRTRFQLNIHMYSKTIPEHDWMIYSNTHVITNTSTSPRHVSFEETQPIPSYLVAFACLRHAHFKELYQFNYFDIPVRIIVDRKLIEAENSIFSHVDENGHPDLSVLAEMTFFTLSFCESIYRVSFTWPKIDILFAPSSFGGMEHPGLIIINTRYYCLGCVVKVLVHELVHQWTGVKLINEYWDGMWINEGFTNYYEFEILFQLESWHRLPVDAFSLHKLLFQYNRVGALTDPGRVSMANFPLAENILALKPHFYPKSRNAVAMLDDAMDLHLAHCLGRIMNWYGHLSISSQSLLEKLTECPDSSLDAVAFMDFWIYSKEVPILFIELLEKKDSKYGYVFHTGYGLLCQLSFEDEKRRCDKRILYSSNPPQFAITFHDFQNNVLQTSYFYEPDNNYMQVEPEFDPIKNPLYIVNLRRRGNYVVRYDDSVYESFFRAFDQSQGENFTDFSAVYEVPKMFSFFLTDLYELSRRDIVKFHFLFELLQRMTLFRELGKTENTRMYFFPVSTILSSFQLCLKTRWLRDLLDRTDIDPVLADTARRWLCKMYERPDSCYFDFSWILQNNDCFHWNRVFGVSAAEALVDFFESSQ